MEKKVKTTKEKKTKVTKEAVKPKVKKTATKTIKKIKEEKENIEEPKFKPGPVNMDLVDAIRPLSNTKTGQIDSRLNLDDVLKKDSKTFLKEKQKPEKELSVQALKWEKYLNYTGWTAEDFLKKYPNHKFKEFIEELINFKKNN